MKKINVCPSTLQKGYETYSPQATKLLFDGETVSHVFAGTILQVMRNVQRLFIATLRRPW